LRKYLKIKACSILLAWGLIFAHSIIPHTHLDDCTANCCESTHESCPVNEGQGSLPEFLSHPGDLSVCHLSGFIYHQFDQDNLISSHNENSIISPYSQVTEINFHSSEAVPAEHLNGSASFRAPPLA
jgi:hypothetical protein